MRIIAGKFKGRKLVSFKADHIRPTSDRVKESVFSKLQSYWEGAQVLDLYTGTGNLSIEALSRGAKNTVSVEKSKKSIAITKKNRDLFSLKDQMEIIEKEVFQFLKTSNIVFDIILIDPPFTEKLADSTMEALAKSKVYNSSSIICIESSSHEVIKDHYPPLLRFDFKKYGDKLVSFFKMESNDET